MSSLHGLEPEQLARIGMFYLEEAILDLLFEAERGLGPTEISRGVGTLLPGGNFKDAIVAGFLAMLEHRGLVEHVGYGDWRLSEIEREKRHQD
jgi:repressor of nif and glnA expression